VKIDRSRHTHIRTQARMHVRYCRGGKRSRRAAGPLLRAFAYSIFSHVNLLCLFIILLAFSLFLSLSVAVLFKNIVS
jgi:hypothetical protein